MSGAPGHLAVFFARLPILRNTPLKHLLDAVPSPLFPAGGDTLAELLAVAGLKRSGLPAPREGIHGVTHFRMVAALGVSLARSEGWDPTREEHLADLWCLWTAGCLHDLERWDDGLDPGHASRGAALARVCLPTQGVPEDLTATVARLILHHGEGEESTFPPLDRIFKDADGLDRFRLGPRSCHPGFLRTESATRLWPEMAALYGGWR